jgi:hypothetical protein
MNKRNIISFVIALFIVAGGAFYGGMVYGQNKNKKLGNLPRGNFQNMTSEQRQQAMQQFGNGAGRPEGVLGGIVGGEVINKDDKSITIKLRDGGSKIVFYSASTTVDKNVAGATTDLEVGKQVTINGSANSDGSITASNVQILPDATTQTLR